MKIDMLTLFPEMFSALESGILGRALERGLIELQIYHIRDFSLDKHKKCDDYPFGGGAGMVMTPEPLTRAVEAADPDHRALRIYLTPRGKTLDQKTVVELARAERLLLVSGSYEGVDQRFIDLCIDQEISIGDYVLTSGDLPAMVLINAVSRYVEGVLGSAESTAEESFGGGLLEYPQYTRPKEFRGMVVPDVLQSGHHGKIAEWRRQQQLQITKERRPDLFEKFEKE